MRQFLFTSFRRRLVDKALLAYRRFFTGRVLDLGGGQTRGRFPHGKTLGWLIVDENPRLKPTVVADAHRLPFRDDVFSAVKCSELTGYLFSPFVVLKEIFRILRPGGVAVITAPYLTPFDEEQHDGVRLTSAWWRWAVMQLPGKIVAIEAQGYFLTVMADFVKTAVYHWWLPLRYLAYLTVFPILEVLVWAEARLPLPSFSRRFSTGFLIVFKKPLALR